MWLVSVTSTIFPPLFFHHFSQPPNQGKQNFPSWPWKNPKAKDAVQYCIRRELLAQFLDLWSDTEFHNEPGKPNQKGQPNWRVGVKIGPRVWFVAKKKRGFLGGGNSNVVYFHNFPIPGVSWSNLTSIFFKVEITTSVKMGSKWICRNPKARASRHWWSQFSSTKWLVFMYRRYRRALWYPIEYDISHRRVPPNAHPRLEIRPWKGLLRGSLVINPSLIRPYFLGWGME